MNPGISEQVLSNIKDALEANKARKGREANQERMEEKEEEEEEPEQAAMAKPKRQRGDKEPQEGGGQHEQQQKRARASVPLPGRCPRMQRCWEFLQSIQLHASYFDPRFDRCYCTSCAAQVRMPDVLERGGEHGSAYEVPKDCCGFGLKVPARAEALEVFKKWAVSFHGCPSSVLLKILEEGQLRMPGETLVDGSTLPNRLTRGGQDRIGLYTSPSIKYSELDIYTKPVTWQGYKVRTVLQCRQNLKIEPPALRIEGETIGWKRRFGDAPISQHFSNEEIERYTTSNNSIIPYRILVSFDVVTREDQEVAAQREAQEERRKLEEKVARLRKEAGKAEKERAAAEKERAAAERAMREAAERMEEAAERKEKLEGEMATARQRLAQLPRKR